MRFSRRWYALASDTGFWAYFPFRHFQDYVKALDSPAETVEEIRPQIIRGLNLVLSGGAVMDNRALRIFYGASDGRSANATVHSSDLSVDEDDLSLETDLEAESEYSGRGDAYLERLPRRLVLRYKLPAGTPGVSLPISLLLFEVLLSAAGSAGGFPATLWAKERDTVRRFAAEIEPRRPANRERHSLYRPRAGRCLIAGGVSPRSQGAECPVTPPAARVGERLAQMFGVRREVSQTPDLVALLLGHLAYDWPPRPTPACVQGLQRIKGGTPDGLNGLTGVMGPKASEFGHWLTTFLTINSTSRGVSFYPFHPSLALSGNGEGPRVDGFLTALAGVFTTSERDRLVAAVWDARLMPAFERAVHGVVHWQMGDAEFAPAAPDSLFLADGAGSADDEAGVASDEARRVLRTAKEDLLYLAQAVSGTRLFVEHASRVLAFSMARYLLVRAGVSLDIPLYRAPAADTHPAVKTLAHEVLTIHRNRFREALRVQFGEQLAEALHEQGFPDDPADEATARAASRQVFGAQANVVPPGSYARQRDAARELRRHRAPLLLVPQRRWWALPAPASHRAAEPHQEGRTRPRTIAAQPVALLLALVCTRGDPCACRRPAPLLPASAPRRPHQRLADTLWALSPGRSSLGRSIPRPLPGVGQPGGAQ